MSALLFTHLIAIGIWAGCVATEAVLEIALERAPPQTSGLASLLKAKVALGASAVVLNGIAD